MLTRNAWVRVSSMAIGLCCAVPVAVGQSRKSSTGSLAGLPLPVYKVDPSWPKMPLRNKWLLQGIPTMVTDHNDHIWVLSRPRDIRPR